MEPGAEARDCRRESWSAPDATVARRYAIGSGQLYTWRRELLSVQTSIIARATRRFAEVETEPAPPRHVAVQPAPAASPPPCTSAARPRSDGLIELVMPSEVGRRMDAQADGRALRRILGDLAASERAASKWPDGRRDDMGFGHLIRVLGSARWKCKIVEGVLTLLICFVITQNAISSASAESRGLGERSTPRMCTAATRCADLVVPNFEHKDHMKRFILSRYPSAPQPASIAMRLPSRLAGEDGKSPEVTFGAQFFLWPDMTGATDARNARFGMDCTGYCGGRMLVTVAYGYAAPSLGDRSFNGFLATYSQYGATFRPVKSIEGFDIALHEEPAPNRDFGANTMYFATPYPGHSSTSLECAEKSPFPVCQARFSSDRYEGLTMAVSTSAFELHDWRIVQARIVSLVEGGVVSLLR